MHQCSRCFHVLSLGGLGLTGGSGSLIVTAEDVFKKTCSVLCRLSKVHQSRDVCCVGIRFSLNVHINFSRCYVELNEHVNNAPVLMR